MKLQSKREVDVNELFEFFNLSSYSQEIHGNFGRVLISFINGKWLTKIHALSVLHQLTKETKTISLHPL